jgi:hypothetical protein
MADVSDRNVPSSRTSTGTLPLGFMVKKSVPLKVVWVSRSTFTVWISLNPPINAVIKQASLQDGTA